MIYDIQKASLMKRISAFLFDLIMLVILSVGCMTLISSIAGYDTYPEIMNDRITLIQENYKIDELEKEHKVSFDNYQLLSEEEAAKIPSYVLDTFKNCDEEIANDEEIIRAYEMILSLSVLICSLGVLIAFLVLEFGVPMLLKNGQTLGKKIFAIAVMRVDAVKVSTFELFIRTILGKYTIGTMVPILMLISLAFGFTPLIPITIILLILLLQLVTLITTKTNSLIHDKLASTVVVDLQSQMIFDTVEAKNEYVLRVQKERADKAPY